MPNDCISYKDSGYFTPLIIDYLDQVPALQPLYNRFPTLENFGPQILEKKQNYTGSRDVLVSVLKAQYQNVELSRSTKQNIDLLSSPDTFTITTGHQLNLFTGPMYFLYKIVTAINLAKELKVKYP